MSLRWCNTCEKFFASDDPTLRIVWEGHLVTLAIDSRGLCHELASEEASKRRLAVLEAKQKKKAESQSITFTPRGTTPKPEFPPPQPMSGDDDAAKFITEILGDQK